jgi:hypothetical protein
MADLDEKLRPIASQLPQWTLDPEGTGAMIGALIIFNLGLASFMVERGLDIEAIRPRLDQISGAISWGHSPRVAENLASIKAGAKSVTSSGLCLACLN